MKKSLSFYSIFATVLGLVVLAFRAISLCEDPTSIKAWFELCGIAFLTILAATNIRK